MLILKKNINKNVILRYIRNILLDKTFFFFCYSRIIGKKYCVEIKFSRKKKNVIISLHCLGDIYLNIITRIVYYQAARIIY